MVSTSLALESRSRPHCLCPLLQPPAVVIREQSTCAHVPPSPRTEFQVQPQSRETALTMPELKSFEQDFQSERKSIQNELFACFWQHFYTKYCHERWFMDWLLFFSRKNWNYDLCLPYCQWNICNCRGMKDVTTDDLCWLILIVLKPHW